MEKNITVIGVSMVFVLLVLGVFCAKNIITLSSESENSLTKAICDENNYCEDYEIVCKGNEIIGLNPTGFAVQFSEKWEDPRSDKDKEIGCD